MLFSFWVLPWKFICWGNPLTCLTVSHFDILPITLTCFISHICLSSCVSCAVLVWFRFTLGNWGILYRRCLLYIHDFFEVSIEWLVRWLGTEDFWLGLFLHYEYIRYWYMDSIIFIVDGICLYRKSHNNHLILPLPPPTPHFFLQMTAFHFVTFGAVLK